MATCLSSRLNAWVGGLFREIEADPELDTPGVLVALVFLVCIGAAYGLFLVSPVLAWLLS